MASLASRWGNPPPAASNSVREYFSPTYSLLCLYLILLFLRPHEYIPSLTNLRLPLVVACLCVASHVLESLHRARRLVQLSPASKSLLWLSLWMLLALPFAFWKGGAFETITNQWLKLLVLFVLLSSGLTSLGQLRRLLWVCTASVMLVSLLAIAEYSPADPSETATRLSAQVGGLYSGANYFSLTIVTLLPFATFLFLSDPGWWARWLAGGAAGVLAAANILTQSRAGTLGFLLILVVWGVQATRGELRRATSLVVLLLGLFVFVTQAPGSYWRRISTLVEDPPPEELATSAYLRAAVDSEQERSELLKKGVLLTLENPVFGVGAGNFDDASARRWNTGTGRDWLASHNTYLQISAELGLPGLALYLLVLGRLFASIRHVRRFVLASPSPDRSALLLAEVLGTMLLVYVFMSLFASVAYDPYFFLVAGLIEALRHQVLPPPQVAPLHLVRTPARAGRG